MVLEGPKSLMVTPDLPESCSTVMPMVICPECHTENIVLARRCWKCGHVFSLDAWQEDHPGEGSVSNGEPLIPGRGMYPGWTFSGEQQI